jgi:hypothetical protein
LAIRIRVDPRIDGATIHETFMSDSTRIKPVSDLAVFSRNHAHYLEAASERKRDTPTTFRSRVRWVTAAGAIKVFGPRSIYFVSVDGARKVDYQADLVEVQLDPDTRKARTRRLLGYELSATKKGKEELWSNSVKTLYVIENCRRLRSGSFSQTRLRKSADGTKLHRDYRRSYAIVHTIG